MNTKFFYFAAAAMMLAACSNDESVNEVANDNIISLTASVAGPSTTRAGVDVQSTAFDAGAEINVECTPTGGTMASAVYTAAAASEGKNALSLKSGQTALTWPASGTVNINAYYPSTVTSTTTSFSVLEDQSTDATNGDANYKASDLMYSTPIADQAKQSAAVGLTFNHALTKIIVNLTKGTGMSDADIAACTVTLSAKKTATITEGNFAGLTASDAAAVTITAGTGANTAAIIVPQTIDASTDFITITTSGSHSVSYSLPAEKTFAAGSVYTYNFTLGMSGITLQSTTITGWDSTGDGKTIDGGTLTL